MVAEKSFPWGSTTQQSHLSYQHAATLVVAAKYEQSLACVYYSPQELRHLWEIAYRGKSPRISYGANVCCLLRSISCMSLSTQLLTIAYLLSMCYAPAAYPECHRQNTTAISRTISAQAPTVSPGYLFNSLLPEYQVVRKSLYLHSTWGPRLLC